MSVVDEAKKLIIAKGGSVAGIQTIGEAVAELTDLEWADNPLSALTVDFTISAEEDLFGKHVADLQSNMAISGDNLSGTLKYHDGYSPYAHHSVALHITVPNVTGYTIKAKIKNEVTLDADGILVGHIVSNNQKIVITASKDGYVSYTRVLDLSGVTLAPKAS